MHTQLPPRFRTSLATEPLPGAGRLRSLATQLLLAAGLLLVVAACDRNIEPFIEGETPRDPDLAHIFPAGEQTGPGLATPQLDSGAAAQGVRATLPPSRTASRAGDAGGGDRSGASDSGQTVTGRIEIAAELGGQGPADGVLFIIARRDSAGGPPLAVRRVASPTFPLDFELGQQHVMVEGVPFEGNIRISVRLDADGNAMTRDPGDLAGEAQGLVRPGARGVRIALDEKL